PARLILARVGVFLNVNLREPFHVADAIPSRNEEPKRRALMLRQWLAVQRPREERFGRQRLFAIQAAPERHVDLELLRAPFDFLFAVIVAEEDELARRRFHACRIEHRFQRDTGPPAVAAQAIERTAVAGAFE